MHMKHTHAHTSIYEREGATDLFDKDKDPDEPAVAVPPLTLAEFYKEVGTYARQIIAGAEIGGRGFSLCRNF